MQKQPPKWALKSWEETSRRQKVQAHKTTEFTAFYGLLRILRLRWRNSMNESDPTGRQPNDAGAKLDAGKNRLGLVLGGFSSALQEVGKVGTYGAKKYSDNG